MAVAGGSVRRVETQSATDQVAHELRRAIISGSLAPGQEFSLREIADLLGVDRKSVV